LSVLTQRSCRAIERKKLDLKSFVFEIAVTSIHIDFYRGIIFTKQKPDMYKYIFIYIFIYRRRLKILSRKNQRVGSFRRTVFVPRNNRDVSDMSKKQKTKTKTTQKN